MDYGVLSHTITKERPEEMGNMETIKRTTHMAK